MLKKVAFGVVLLYVLAGFFLLPILVKSELESRTPQYLNASLTLSGASFNPFTFELSLKGLDLVDLDGKSVLSVDEIYVDLDPTSLLRGVLFIKDITINKPHINTAMLDDGELNLASLVKKSEPQTAKEQDSALRVYLHALKVYDASFGFEDVQKSFAIGASKIYASLENIDTNGLSDGSFSFIATLSDASHIYAKATIPSLFPLKLDGEVQVDSLHLATLFEYVRDRFKFALSSGKLDLKSHFFVDSSDLSLSDTRASLADLLITAGDARLVGLARVDLDMPSARVLQNSYRIESVTLDDLVVDAIKEGESIDLLSYFLADTKDKNSEQKEAKELDLRIKRVDLNSMSATFDDRSVGVKSLLDSLQAKLVGLDTRSDDSFELDLTLGANGKASCSASSSIYLDGRARGEVSCKEIEITRYKPYIYEALKGMKRVDLVSLEAGFGTSFELFGDESFTLSGASLDLANLVVGDASHELVSVDHLEVSGASFESSTNDLSIDLLRVKKPKARLDRLEDGSFYIASLVEASDGDKSRSDPLKVKLKKVDLSGGEVSFSDEKSSLHLKLDGITLRASGIDTKELTKADVAFEARLNGSTKVSSKAKVQHTPLLASGSLDVMDLDLSLAQSFVDDVAYIAIKSGKLDLQSSFGYDSSELSLDGDAKLKSLYIEDARSSQTVLSLREARFDEFGYRQNALNIKRVTLDSLFSDIMIKQDRSLSLAELIKPNDANSSKTDEPTTPFSYNIARVNFKDSSAFFADYSIPIHFKTLVHSLNGGINSISNRKGEISHLKLNGVVDNYGEARLDGSLRSEDVKSYLDMGLSFKNLDLSAMSGYSAEFAGYKIDDGRLFLELEYKINDSKLKSKNNLTIKQIALGEEIKDENVTKLPLPLAVMLLEDSNGVIDVDLPIEGDVDSPDFKYGKLALKAFGNLILKVVASPFKFLATSLGLSGGDELSGLNFEVASSKILPYEKEKLDKIVTAFEQKDLLKLHISGGYDELADTKALKVSKLKREIFTNASKEKSITQRLEELYEDGDFELSLDELRSKLLESFDEKRLDVEYQKRLFELVSSTKEVSLDEVLDLARSRSEAIKEYLVDIKAIDLSRVIIDNISAQKPTPEGFVPTIFTISLE
ncbi:MAG: DUF748 domain-containing protein [Sulfuricurvum sp.]